MYILSLSCPDRPGLVAVVANSLHGHNCNIEEAAQFNDPLSGRFFMRVVFSAPEGDASSFQSDFANIATEHMMEWQIHNKTEPVKTLILVSQWDHCLNDLLYRWRTNHLNIDITGVVSNHETSRRLVEERGLDFHYLPITPETKAEQEASLHALIEETGTELIILARYMQILSNDFCGAYEGRIINIHHSFLPGFKGAKPYAQAYERGVKIIGATAHFVTADLDEGPIITQHVTPIDHSYTPEKMQAVGRDLEAQALARATELYTERRIFAYHGRTVIL
jgi:formyltetrahydrofolate deformylase